MLPSGWFELALRIANERLREAIGALNVVEAKAALGAEKVAVDAAFVAIVGANDLRAVIRLAHAESDLAAVGAMCADGRNVVHLPGPRLVAVAAAGQRADRANVDAHAALLAVKLVAVVRDNDGVDGAVVDAEGPDIHALAAHANAAIAKDAPRAIVENGRRPLLLVAMKFHFDELAFACAVLEVHVLQLALAAGVANGAVERMVAEEQLDGGFARLRDLSRLGDEDLAFGDGGGAGSLQLGDFFLAYNAHAAGGLKREAGIVAKGRNLDARLAARVNEQRSRRSGELFSVDSEGYVGHLFLVLEQILGNLVPVIRR